MNRSITEHFSFLPESLSWIKLNQVLGLLTFLAVCQFVFENVAGCFYKDFKRSLKFLMAPLSLIAICGVSGYIGQESFKNEFVLVDLLYQMLFNVSLYRLMIANMTKSEYSPISFEHLIGLLPMIIHLTSESKY